MANEQYKVDAQIEVGAEKVKGQLDGLIKRLRSFQGGIRKVNLGFDGMATKMLALGATYFSFQTLTRGAIGLGKGILDASAEAEAMQASLATIYSAVEKVSFKQATEDAGALFRTLEKVAIVSTATAPELMQVFQGIYGPLRNAGLSIQQIVDTTNNAAVAASAMGIDFAQASRDISAMARGTAGLDVKTFSLLQSMGLIKETTEEWNKLAPDKRAKKLMDVMGKIGGQAAEAYGRTWKGLSSTFSDIMGAFKRAFGSAVFERLKGTLEKINKHLLANRERIEAYLRVLGERVGTIFDKVINNAGEAYRNAVSNIDAIRSRMEDLYAKFQALKPTIVAAAKFGLGIQLAATAFNALVPALSALVTGITWIVSGIAAIAAAGGLGAWFAGIVVSIKAFGASLAALAWPITIAVAAITAIIAGAIKFRDVILKMLKPLEASVGSIVERLVGIFKDLWASVKPVLEVLGGGAILGVIAGFRMLAWLVDNILLPPFQLLAKIIRWLAEGVIHPIFKGLEVVMLAVVKLFNWLGEMLAKVTNAMGRLVDWIEDKIGGLPGKIWDKTGGKLFSGGEGESAASKEVRAFIKASRAQRRVAREKAVTDIQGINKKIAEDVAKAQRAHREKEILSKERTGTVNDFRGSKITINQDFREADPDNVFIQFRDGLEREAIARTRSGYADALAR